MTDSGFTRTALALDGDERFVSLRRPLELSGMGMNLIILAPGQRGRVHDHERQEEVYLVWEGTLTLIVEGEPHDLERGELARVGPGVRRQIVNRGPGRCAIVALGATPGRAHGSRRPRLGLVGGHGSAALAAGRAAARRPAGGRAPQLARRCASRSGQMPCLPGERMPFGSSASLIVSVKRR